LKFVTFKTLKSSKNIAEKFNRLSRVYERHRQTTDIIAVTFPSE